MDDVPAEILVATRECAALPRSNLSSIRLGGLAGTHVGVLPILTEREPVGQIGAAVGVPEAVGQRDLPIRRAVDGA